MNKPHSPIGILDSGLGGLSLVKAVKKLLPKEQLIYFADTAHLPFGDKSNLAIQGFSSQICQLLLDYGCKAILSLVILHLQLLLIRSKFGKK